MSSDEDADKCPICLNSFSSQPVATPENCEHYFCLDCILAWAKVSYMNPRRKHFVIKHVISFSCEYILCIYEAYILEEVEWLILTF